MADERSYTIAAAAELTGLHRNTIRMKVKTGQLHASVEHGKFGDEYRITHDALVAAGLVPGVTAAERQAAQARQPGPAHADVLDAEFTEPRDALSGDAAVAMISGLRELFERHESSVYRLGYAEAELERTRALAERAESLQTQREGQIAEVARLRTEVERLRQDAARVRELEAELASARRRLAELDALRADLAALREEHDRLLALLKQAEADQRRPWWRRS